MVMTANNQELGAVAEGLLSGGGRMGKGGGCSKRKLSTALIEGI